MTISATDILVHVCFKTPLLYLLTQKVAQKFGYVLGIKLNIRRDELLREMEQLQEDCIKALPVKIGDKIMDEDGRVGWLSKIVPYRSPSERFMRSTLQLTLFFHMEKKDGTRDTHEVYVHGLPIKL